MQAHRFSNVADFNAFMLAGRAIFTMRSQSGKRYTLRVSRADSVSLKIEGGRVVSKLNKAGKPVIDTAPRWDVELLTGSDNTGDYRTIGMITSKHVFHGFEVLTNAEESNGAKAFDWLMTSKSYRAGQVPSTVELWHVGRCGRCGRALTVPESIESGIGPVCAEKE